MEHVCPLCNGLVKYVKYCEKCDSSMENGGRIQDYYDDYSPYLGHNITDVMDEEPSYICQHIFTCPVCRHDDVVNIERICY